MDKVFNNLYLYYHVQLLNFRATEKFKNVVSENGRYLVLCGYWKLLIGK